MGRPISETCWTRTGDHPATGGTQIRDKTVQQLHRVELCLVGQHHAPGVRQGDGQVVAPARGQPHRRRGLVLAQGHASTSIGVGGIGHPPADPGADVTAGGHLHWVPRRTATGTMAVAPVSG
ncbi:hypothetical protein ON003_16300 [Janibacter hoylei]|uniref:hypothetical protein n=1 Tax=Janibacter hoylei TaxID=364298 RepID=UPI002237D4D8|nr:hypothetical protein [Janibacter hoylei]MCW4602978.1 hypothetical protein [Janibacter hoylei]